MGKVGLKEQDRKALLLWPPSAMGWGTSGSRVCGHGVPKAIVDSGLSGNCVSSSSAWLSSLELTALQVAIVSGTQKEGVARGTVERVTEETASSTGVHGIRREGHLQESHQS